VGAAWLPSCRILRPPSPPAAPIGDALDDNSFVLQLIPSEQPAFARLPPSRVQASLKRVGHLMLVVLVPLAAASGYRAWVQVWALNLVVSGVVLGPGSIITVSALTSGRVTVDLRLELVQDGHADLIATSRVTTNRNPAMDPRPRRGGITLVVTDAMAAGWPPGHATLRVTARGRPQFLREPPPEVREVAVVVERP